MKNLVIDKLGNKWKYDKNNNGKKIYHLVETKDGHKVAPDGGYYMLDEKKKEIVANLENPMQKCPVCGGNLVYRDFGVKYNPALYCKKDHRVYLIKKYGKKYKIGCQNNK